MDQDEIELEEGELSDDSDTYTPLERPADYSGTQPNPRFSIPVPESESEAELQSSDSDSDYDTNKHKNKKPKIKLKPKLPEVKRKKYDIWSTRVQEDVLAETLNSCDVSIKDRSRDVESYDYPSYDRTNNKRSRDDRRNTNLKLVNHGNAQEKVKGRSKSIPDLTVGITDNPEDIAQDMANKLCEEKKDLILRVINTVGPEKTFNIFKETKRIEDEGGMMIMNQTRRRTPGGVFLFLVRHDDDLTSQQKSEIFQDEKEKAKVMLRNKNKKKMKKLKEEIAASKKLLPDLLTRAELLTNENNRVRKESDERDVINPPPTPETDGHENSGDGMDPINGADSLDNSRRKCESYDDDFLDIHCSSEMDLF